ncbi:hypothetical protein EJ06DRAFT_526564 [Trichodelitschia bisporula]|uniref:Ubiquitin interaction motif protein n=1 Tax=Trichodelitschia bisporula TaxID=703511 RepID=A0A6G1I919_9PEZI|nr:hypothetical protein EJ06DRAFT_526564 [Trichodelitschia bisporula]
MASSPSQEAIQGFQAIAQCDEITAQRFLQGTNNDLETAIGQYFDNPERYSQQDRYNQQSYAGYDETAFSQGRYGDDFQGDSLPAFQIHSSDENGQHYVNSTAPTRPPSRASQKDNAITSQQEIGVIEGSEGYFGPAKQAYYDPSQWTLTVANPKVPDPDPPGRLRAETQPAFLKPLANKDALPSLLTILHSIPLARKHLLACGVVRPDYGFNGQWWNGEGAIDPLEEETETEEVLAETQRLMAFLTNTTRSYGSAQALSKLSGLKGNAFTVGEVESLADDFLASWSYAAKPHSPEPEVTERLFRTDIAMEGTSRKEVYYAFNLKIGMTEQSLYDAVDQAIWRGNLAGDTETDHYLSEVPHILVMHIAQLDASRTGLEIPIPPVWYADRYLKENLTLTRSMRKDGDAYRNQVIAIESRMGSLEMFKYKKNRITLPSSILLEGAIEALEMGAKTEATDGDQSLQCTELIEKLRRVSAQIEQKLQALNEERKKTVKRLEEVWSLFMQPAKMPDEPSPTHRYNLCGVSIGHNLTHTLYPTQADRAEASPEWWYIEYQDTRECVIKKQVTEADVLDAARNKSREVTLVYATDEAVREQEVQLPRPLAMFVERDNEHFVQECEDFIAQTQRRGADGTHEPPPYTAEDDAWAGDSTSTNAGWEQYWETGRKQRTMQTDQQLDTEMEEIERS